MSGFIEDVSLAARQAAEARDWARVHDCASRILHRHAENPEGFFLLGLAEKSARRPGPAIAAFQKAVQLDNDRYDAAMELAGLYLGQQQHAEAVELVDCYASRLGNSPRYLDIAAGIYLNAGLPQRAWPLYRKADELQPGVDSLRASLAGCGVFVGELDEARTIYRQLLHKYPGHQRNHYELSRLETARDNRHIEQMKRVAAVNASQPARNIYIHFALGKELEDLGQWNEAFHYYRQANDAVASVAGYDVQADIDIIDAIIENCGAAWLQNSVGEAGIARASAEPVFIVGLPRSGTTLTERILSCHSAIESAGESYFIPIGLKSLGGMDTADSMSPAIVAAAANGDAHRLARSYRQSIRYKLSGKPLFIEKFPENAFYLGFIAKAFPRARMILVNREPMDACFAMYKQSYFRYAYTLDDLGKFYVAWQRLVGHWRELLGVRLVEINYEDLVRDQEAQTRFLLDKLAVSFDPACLDFERNLTASNTASAVQVREKIHSRSVGRWQHFSEPLRPLQDFLEDAGIFTGALR